MIFNLDNAARELENLDWSDITACKVTGPVRWNAAGELDIPFTPNPSVAERAAIKRRILSMNSVEEALRERADSAYGTLQQFEALAAPTNAQVVGVVKLLCKVVRGLIRLQLKELDSVD